MFLKYNTKILIIYIIKFQKLLVKSYFNECQGLELTEFQNN